MATVEIEPELRLKRFLYFCSEEPRHVTCSSRYHSCCQLSKITSLMELITADKEISIIELIDSVKNDPLCSRRETLVFVLAALTRNAKTTEIRNLAYNRVLEVCNTNEELFLYIKYAHWLRKTFSHGARRVICDYYLKKDPLDLFNIITKFNSYNGWCHQDVFKIMHIKPEINTAQELLISYVMKDLKTVKKILDSMEENENSAHIQDIFNKLEKYDSLRHCHSDEQALILVKENNFKLEQIPSELLKTQILWDYLIPKLDILELLPQLMRLNRLGFLKSNNQNSVLNKVVESLSDTKKCIASKIQPSQALIYLKTFERGKPMDPQKKLYFSTLTKEDEDGTKLEPNLKDSLYSNPPKNNAIISSLYKLLQHSFKNLQPTGRRFLITLDVRDANMKRLCFTNKAVTCYEAAALITFSLLKVEKDVTVAYFDGESINTVPIDKNMTYSQALQKIKEIEGGHVVLHNTFNWAIKNNKSIDVFLNILLSADCLHKPPKEIKNSENIIVALKRYRQKVHLQNTKMINVSLRGRKLEIADGSAHVLDICGFDQYVPKMIEACCKGVLQ